MLSKICCSFFSLYYHIPQGAWDLSESYPGTVLEHGLISSSRLLSQGGYGRGIAAPSVNTCPGLIQPFPFAFNCRDSSSWDTAICHLCGCWTSAWVSAWNSDPKIDLNPGECVCHSVDLLFPELWVESLKDSSCVFLEQMKKVWKEALNRWPWQATRESPPSAAWSD